MNKHLRDIEERRAAGEDLCESGNATGIYEGTVCDHCLGQKVLLTQAEFDFLLSLNDDILDAEYIS